MPTRRDFIVGTLGATAVGGAGGHFLFGNGGPEQRSATAGCLDVRDFGARGDGVADDSDAVQSAIDAASARGQSVYCPASEYRLAIEIPDGVEVVGEPGTVFRAASGRSVVRLTGSRSALSTVQVVGSRKDSPGRGLAAHCIEVRGSEVRLEDVRSGAARYDSVYVRAGRGVFFYRCSFEPTARNTCSIVAGSEIWFVKCQFSQDKSVSSSSYNGLYLYDVEPQAPNQAYGLKHIECTFRSDLRDGYAGVILDAHGNRDTGNNDVSFVRCAFQKSRAVAPSIRLRNGKIFRDLLLIDNTFAGPVLTNDEPIVLSESILVGNQHFAQRFSYNVTLDDVVLVSHRGAGWTGLKTTAATIRVNSG